jgi:hypothetical protein
MEVGKIAVKTSVLGLRIAGAFSLCQIFFENNSKR